jgi:hypothetical protein
MTTPPIGRRFHAGVSRQGGRPPADPPEIIPGSATRLPRTCDPGRGPPITSGRGRRTGDRRAWEPARRSPGPGHTPWAAAHRSRRGPGRRRPAPAHGPRGRERKPRVPGHKPPQGAEAARDGQEPVPRPGLRRDTPTPTPPPQLPMLTPQDTRPAWRVAVRNDVPARSAAAARKGLFMRWEPGGAPQALPTGGPGLYSADPDPG